MSVFSYACVVYASEFVQSEVCCDFRKATGMKTIPIKIGQTEVLLATCDKEIEISKNDGDISAETEEQSPYMPTSAEKRSKKIMGDAYSAMKDVLKNISEDIGDRLNDIELPKRPKQVEMEFSIGVAGEGKLIILNGKVEAGVKIKLTWERENSK